MNVHTYIYKAVILLQVTSLCQSLISVTAEIIVEFDQTRYDVSEGDGFALLTLVSSTPIDTEYTVEVLTQDGTAKGMYMHTYVHMILYPDWWQHQRDQQAHSERYPVYYNVQ